MLPTNKLATVTIKMSRLLYDIANETFLRGRVLLNKDNHKDVASMYANEDEGHREKILRSIKRAYADVRTVLDEYLNEWDDIADNSLIDDGVDLELNLIMPDNYSEGATTGLCEAVHAYLVNSAVADWYVITNKEEAEQYYALASKAMELVRQTASKRRRPVRPANGDCDYL